MTTYATRYQASKHAHRDEIIVKVYGGYVLMEPSVYQAWRKQK